MAIRRSFKSDVSFLEKISMGAIGTLAVLDDLIKQGHNPIELERGSTSFKIWKNIKIKRIRVPDILCTSCGKCVESRTKTKPEISMSHSHADPERGWDHGLNDRDEVAFVICKKVGENPIDWEQVGPIQYVSIKEMKNSFQNGLAVLSTPKGSEEGFEMRLIWPTATASSAGIVSNINNNRIQYKRNHDHRTISLRLEKKGKAMAPLTCEGDIIEENQVIASVVPVHQDFVCNKEANEENFIESLSSSSISERYAATKALGHIDSASITEALSERLSDPNEHVYVRLEAAAGLARHNAKSGFEYFQNCLKDEYLQNRLETVIVLGEIESTTSCKLLIDALLDKEQHADIRAGAAWAIGELKNKIGLESLIDSFSEVDENIKIEAARALAKLGQKYTPEIIKEFSQADINTLPGISWALSRAGKFKFSNMVELTDKEECRQWIAYIIGTQDQEQYIREIEKLRKKDPEVYFAVTVLWNTMKSWIWNLEEY